MGRRRTAAEKLDLRYSKFGKVFKSVYPEMRRNSDLPPAIFDIIENHLIDYRCETLRDYEHGELASACTALVLHLRQRHMSAGDEFTSKMILFFNSAFRYVDAAENRLSELGGGLGKTAVKDRDLMQELMPKWDEAVRRAVAAIKTLREVQTNVDKLRDPLTTIAEAAVFTALDSLTEYFPRRLDRKYLTQLAEQVKPLFARDSTVKPESKYQYLIAYEAIVDITKLHDVLDAPLEKLGSQDAVALFRVRQPTAAVVATQLLQKVLQ